MNPELSVILPTYNESGNIERLLRTIAQVCRKAKIVHEIIVVDDNSPDRTAALAKKRAKQDRTVQVFIRTRNRGLAKSILLGIKKARGEHVLVMDTDFNHDPRMIPLMFRLRAQVHMVIGSRYISGGGMENRLRYWLSFLFNLYLRLLLQSPIHDHLSGFFLMKRIHFNKPIMQHVFYGFGDYFIRLVYFAQKERLRISEVPVFYKDRRYGASKSRFLPMFISYTYSALKLRLQKI